MTCNRCYNKRRARASLCEDCGKELKRKNNQRCRPCHYEHIRDMAEKRKIGPDQNQSHICIRVPKSEHKRIVNYAYSNGYGSITGFVRAAVYERLDNVQ